MKRITSRTAIISLCLVALCMGSLISTYLLYQQSQQQVCPAIHPTVVIDENLSDDLPVALATMVTSEDYVNGARVLLESFKRKTKRKVDYIAFTIPGKLSQRATCLLRQAGWQVRVFEPLYSVKQKLNPGHKFMDQFTKLRLFNLTEYSKIMYVDADTLLLESIDELFKVPSVFASVRDYMVTKRSFTSDFNCGMFVLEPSIHLYNKLMELMNETSSYGDYHEQSFLSWVFNKNGTVLPQIYNGNLAIHEYENDLWQCNYAGQVKLIHYTLWKPWNAPTRHCKTICDNHAQNHPLFAPWYKIREQLLSIKTC